VRRPSPTRLLILVLCVAFLGRIALALRPGLWADEIFSLAMATGHSLEQPAAESDPNQGDFLEPRDATPAGTFQRYVDQGSPPADARRVIRAVYLSDTSPPLYYLLLSSWTRLFGTGDASLRLCSLLFTVLALPLVWLLGRDLGGPRLGWTAGTLFAFSPVSVFYSLEGRMYSLLWFFAAGLAWTTLGLSRRGSRPGLLAAWIALAAGGLLTHYFFLFVWLAFAAWLILVPGRLGRAPALVLTAVSALAVAPWYVRVPDSLARWRVSGNWLADPLGWPEALTRPFELAWSLLAGGSFWGGSPTVDGALAGVYVLLALYLLRSGRVREVLGRERLLLWFWVVAAVCGPLAFDLLRHTSASRVTRYALAGLPGALLLAALGMEQLRGKWHTAFVVLVLLGWTAGLRPILAHRARPGAAYPTLAAELSAWAGPRDVVVVHSIPSGVIGLSRYADPSLPLVSWIAPLELRRVPQDIQRLLQGHTRLALVQVHNLAQPAPAEPWLRAHTRLTRREIYDGALDTLSADTTALPPSQLAAMHEHKMIEVLYFAPASGETFDSAR
jgi:4-amino-4-deoxy-L-arabinose transferase-like glycosyltransferase